MLWIVRFDGTRMLIWEWFFVSLGLIVGSFLNVCILRIPRRRSIVFHGSSCTHCGQALKPYDNIPVASFLLLSGKCRFCKKQISWQYPVVESLTSVIYWATYVNYGFQWKTAMMLVFFSALIVLVFIDLNERILPNVITLPGIILGLTFSLWVLVEDSTGLLILNVLGYSYPEDRWMSLLNSLVGMGVSSGFLWLVAEAYLKLKKVEGMGGGDIKLIGMVGAFLGVKKALLTIMMGSMMGALIGLAFIKLTGKDFKYELPFGSFLGIAAIISSLWGTQLISWYFVMTRIN